MNTRIWNKESKLMSYPKHINFDFNFSEILMSSTDFFDIKNVPIFEGDIVLCWNDVGFLENFNRTTKFIIESENKIFVGKYHGFNDQMLINDKWYEFEYIEVIGNIYEHPELKKFQLSQLR